MKWRINDIEIKNQVVLAPMAGTSTPSYMKIAEEMGVGLVYTELISAEAIVRNNKKTFDMLKGIEELNIPVGLQLFGGNIDSLVKAAKIMTEKYKNIFIDLNAGCPVPKVAIKSEAGSALLKNPEKVGSIIEALTNEISVPITLKIRSGWDSDSINAVEIAKIAEEKGASAICVHPRTRAQGYKGLSDWNIIKEVKNSVNIPVIGNGDIKSKEDAKKMIEKTNCDAVMIGRATQGNPWIIRDSVNYLEGNAATEAITSSEKISMILKHISYLRDNKPDNIVAKEIRSHIGWYLKGIKNGKELKNIIYQTDDIHDIIQILMKCEKELENEEEES